MVKVGDVIIPKLDLSKLPEKGEGGPKISDKSEKAPKLGGGNAFLIGFKAFFKSLASDSSYSEIRNELKKEVIQDKKDKVAAQGELRDSNEARAQKLGSKSKLIAFKTQIETPNLVQEKDRIKTADVEQLFFPPFKDLGNKKSLMAFFTHMISEFKNEMLEKGKDPKDNLKNFKELIAIAIPNSANTTVLGQLDYNIFKMVSEEFGKEFRLEHQEYMDALDSVISDMKDPQSKVAKDVKDVGIEELRSEYHKLKPGSGGGFIRAKGVDAFNLHILKNGGEQLVSESRNFMSTHTTNNNFVALGTAMKNYEDAEKIKPEIQQIKLEVKKGNFSVDGYNALGGMTLDIINHVKSEGINDDLKKTLGEIKDIILKDVVDGKLTKTEAVEALRLLGDSSMVLRFITPEVYGRYAGSSKELLAFSQFLQYVTIEGKLPPTAPDDVKEAYQNQIDLIKPKLRELSAAFGLPTLEQFGQQIDLAIQKKNENNENVVIKNEDGNKNDGGIKNENDLLSMIGVNEKDAKPLPGVKDQNTLNELNAEMDEMEDLNKIVEDEEIVLDPETALYANLGGKGLPTNVDLKEILSEVLGDITPEEQKKLDEMSKASDKKFQDLENQFNATMNPENKSN